LTTLVYKAHGSIRYDSYEEVQLCGRVVERVPTVLHAGLCGPRRLVIAVENVRYTLLPFAHTPPTQ